RADGRALDSEMRCLLITAFIDQQLRQCIEVKSLSAAESSRARTRESLLAAFDCLRGLAEIAITGAKSTELQPFAPAVPDFTRDQNRLLVAFDGFPGLSETGPGQADIREPGPLAAAVFSRAGQIESLLIPNHRLPVLAHAVIRGPEVAGTVLS